MPSENQISSAFSVLYQNFANRDITYIFSGSTVLFSISYAKSGNFLLAIPNIWAAIQYLIISYILGYAIRTAFSVTSRFSQATREPTIEFAIRKLQPKYIALIERRIFVQHMQMSCFGGCSIAAVILTSLHLCEAFRWKSGFLVSNIAEPKPNHEKLLVIVGLILIARFSFRKYKQSESRTTQWYNEFAEQARLLK